MSPHEGTRHASSRSRTAFASWGSSPGGEHKRCGLVHRGRVGQRIVCERAHGRTRPSCSGTWRMAARAAQAIAAWARVERPSRFQWKMTW